MDKTITKTEIIQRLADVNGTTQKQMGEILDSFLSLIGESLKDQDAVNIMNFGKFTSKLVQGREGTNPRDTSQKLNIPTTYRVYFSAGQALKNKVNEALKGGKKAAKKEVVPAKKTVAKKKKK